MFAGVFLTRVVMKKSKMYFTKTEIVLWVISVAIITTSFCLFGGGEILTLIASLVGVTAILLNAKGNPVGQGLMIVFSTIYGIISYELCYYGEMITYLCMTMPMAIVALVAWLKHPYKGNRAEVRVNSISGKEVAFMFALAAVVTVAFYFILKYFNTANLIPSTISVTTSFVAVYLTFRRSPYFSLAYAANDVVLIILWTLATIFDARYISVVVCFAAFLINDIYCFIGWQRIKARQQSNSEQADA